MDKDKTTIDIKLPTWWEELTDRQLRFVFTFIALGYSIDEVKTFSFFRWSSLHILHRYGDDGYMCKRGKQRHHQRTR